MILIIYMLIITGDSGYGGSSKYLFYYLYLLITPTNKYS